MNPLVSIVMLSWNRKSELKKSLSGIKKQDYKNPEIIVVDNGSEDGTQEMIKKEFPEVNLIEVGRNPGVASYNLGFKKAQGQYVVVLDDDSNPSKMAISKALKIFNQKPNLGIIAGNIKNPNGHSETQEWVSVYERFKGPTSGRSFPWFTFIGCGAVIKKEVLDRTGYYPPEYFLYWNENDLSARAIQAGYDIEYHPEIVFEHRVAKKQRTSGRKVFYATRNMYWFVIKYFPFWIALDLLFGIAYMQLKKTLKESLLWPYIKAAIFALFGLPKLLPGRSPIGPKGLQKFEIYLKTTRFSQIINQ